ncbi:MAG: GNAT family N-acetyltransferase [Rhizomicrobium sp.]
MTEIRACTAADFEQILLLLQQLWPDKTLGREQLREVYSRALSSERTQRLLCAVEEERVVGFCSMTIKNNLWIEGFLAHVDELVVDRAKRGRGIGARLLQSAIALARALNCARIELDSAFHRGDAHAFYERQGFENRAYLFSLPLA